jgi:hypothetical protein
MITQNGYVVAVKQSDPEYDTILQKIQNKPTDPEGYQYKLRADNLEWELVELPPEPDQELTDEEALEILLGGAT